MPKFNEWVQSWWHLFEKMEIGQAYEVAKCAKDGELFKEVCRDFIDRHPLGACFEFSNDYKYFKRFTWHKSELKDAGNYFYIKKALSK